MQLPTPSSPFRDRDALPLRPTSTPSTALTPQLHRPQTTFQTSHGQLLDLTTAPIGSVDLAKYTSDNYLRIVTYKTAFYTFYLPVACGMVLAGITVGNRGRRRGPGMAVG